MMDIRDDLAAHIAATLAHSTLAPREIARRAYAVADAMLVQRAEPCFLDDALVAESLANGMAFVDDPELVEPSHDPRWEVSPRWSPEDLAALEARRRGPGLAKPRTPEHEGATQTDDGDDAQQTG